MIRLSSGTAACLGLSANRMDAFPTTAYLLAGDHCRMNCAFCPQGHGNNEALDRLGRITWPEYSWPEVEQKLAEAADQGIERICLQSVRYAGGIGPLLEQINMIKEISPLPLSLSAWIASRQEAEAAVGAGVERLSIAIDVVNPVLYSQIKGGSFARKHELLISCARSLPGRISTHLICGLGESDEELIVLADRLLKEKVTLALFAFVPLKGTRLEHADPPPLDRYRRIQAAFYLLKENLVTKDALIFEEGRLVSFSMPTVELKEKLAGGEAFRTSGCPGCNRPYYNERPGRTVFNYHRPLGKKELSSALNLLPGISPDEKEYCCPLKGL
jgi:lipoyl synthase